MQKLQFLDRICPDCDTLQDAATCTHCLHYGVLVRTLDLQLESEEGRVARNIEWYVNKKEEQ